MTATTIICDICHCKAFAERPIRESYDVPSSSWYDFDGEECYGGGYYRYSKRYRTPAFDDEILITDLSPMNRKKWAYIPSARLWCKPFDKAGTPHKHKVG